MALSFQIFNTTKYFEFKTLMRLVVTLINN